MIRVFGGTLRGNSTGSTAGSRTIGDAGVAGVPVTVGDTRSVTLCSRSHTPVASRFNLVLMDETCAGGSSK